MSVPAFANHREGWICFTAVLAVHGLFVTWLMSKETTIPLEKPVPLVGALYGSAGKTVGRQGKGGTSSKATLPTSESHARSVGKRPTRLSRKTTDAGQERQAGKHAVPRVADNASSGSRKAFSGAPIGKSAPSRDGALNGSGAAVTGPGNGGMASGTGDQRDSGDGTGGFTAPYTDAGLFQNPKPPYPVASRRLGEAGEVILSVFIRADGRVGDVRLKRSSGFARLDKSALDTVKKWRYLPARKNGQPVAFRYVQPIRFSLDD